MQSRSHRQRGEAPFEAHRQLDVAVLEEVRKRQEHLEHDDRQYRRAKHHDRQQTDRQ
ncbi:MAG: hypothetical protein U0587_22570 [Candidatus Binatia bacterium]